jgi:hypothetical protein
MLDKKETMIDGQTGSTVVTTYDMAKDTLRIVRQLRWFIASIISFLIVIGSMLAFMIF